MPSYLNCVIMNNPYFCFPKDCYETFYCIACYGAGILDTQL
jgi:hypothetical protein